MCYVLVWVCDILCLWFWVDLVLICYCMVSFNVVVALLCFGLLLVFGCKALRFSVWVFWRILVLLVCFSCFPMICVGFV